MLQTRFSRCSLSPSAKALTTDREPNQSLECASAGRLDRRHTTWRVERSSARTTWRVGACGACGMCRKMQQQHNIWILPRIPDPSGPLAGAQRDRPAARRVHKTWRSHAVPNVPTVWKVWNLQNPPKTLSSDSAMENPPSCRGKILYIHGYS